MRQKTIPVKTSFVVLLCLLAATAGVHGISHSINANPGTISEKKLFELYKAADQQLEFYGKVIDQDDNPVEGVEVTMRFSQAHNTVLEAEAANDWKKYINTTLTTDANGIFHLSTRGHYLSILNLQKENYIRPRHTQIHFFYGHPASGQNRAGIHIPDPQNPVIYRMWKKAEEKPAIAKQFRHRFNVKDGPQSLNIISGRWNSASSDVIFDVEIFPRVEGSRQHSWSVNISTPSGGIMGTEASHFFLAPESGYKPRISYSSEANSREWTPSLNSRYHYIYSEQNKIYSALGLHMMTFHDGNAIISGTVIFNPTGSRNLQPE